MLRKKKEKKKAELPKSSEDKLSSTIVKPDTGIEIQIAIPKTGDKAVDDMILETLDVITKCIEADLDSIKKNPKGACLPIALTHSERLLQLATLLMTGIKRPFGGGKI